MTRMAYNTSVTAPTVTHQIWATSNARPGDAVAFRTAAVSVVRTTSEGEGLARVSFSETVYGPNRIAREKLAATLARLHAKFPGCQHDGHHLPTFVESADKPLWLEGWS